MANIFDSVQMRQPDANWFDLGHDLKFSLRMGTLVPILLQECIPGDVFKIRTETLLRFAPLVAPVMHDISVYTHYFFVPNRLVWNNWEKFITANNGSSTIPAWPHFNFGSADAPVVQPGSLYDYLGLPTGTIAGNVSAIPFAAYNAIYNEYYRDQNLIPEVDYQLTDGQNAGWTSAGRLEVRRRAWQHDYYTSSLPFAQKGGAVQLPLVVPTDIPINRNASTVSGLNASWNNTLPTSTQSRVENRLAGNPSIPDSALYVNSNNIQAGAATINDLRRAFRLQEWLEKMARGGSRYIEQILVHFGVKSSDARLQRPEFLGGTRSPVIISEVLQTSESAETPQATMAGHAISASGGSGIKYRCEEHGYIIGIQSVMPKTAYQQGIPKHFLRQSHLDYAWPTFAHIGEQPVQNKELYATNSGADDQATFGYVPRYAEYRFQNSRVAGDFRTTLAYWHLGRIFGSRPALNQQFIECVPRNDIFAVTDGPQNLWAHSTHKIQVYRKLPKFGTPTL